MKKELQLIITSLFFSLPSIAMADTSTLKNLQIISNDWHDLEIYPLFDKGHFYEDNSPANDYEVYGSIILGGKQIDGKKPFLWEKHLKKVPLILKYALFNKDTVNPFRPVFPDIYTSDNQKKIKHCGDFIGVQFELDDLPETKEWYIAAPSEYCIYGEKAIIEGSIGSSSKPHVWVLQKNKKGHYRILMESEGKTYIVNKKHQGYKEIVTHIYNKHIYRQQADKNPDTICGSGAISWQYQSDSYQPSGLSPNAYACGRFSKKFINTGVPEKYRIKMEKEVVKPLLVRWLNTFSRVAVTVNEKNEVIPLQINQHRKQKKTVSSNCIKNNAMHKAAARGDYRFIAQCLKKGEDVNLVDKNGWTPLHSAARNGQAGVIQLLIKYKANINAKDKTGRTATDQANYSQHHHIVNFLKKKGGYTTR